MKLKDFIKETEELTTCGYLKNIGVKFEKTKTNGGAHFELSSRKVAKAMVDELASVPELNTRFTYSWDGANGINVDFN